jgi:hypothetical protein
LRTSRVAALDRSQDRRQQRARIAVRAGVAPQPGEVVGGAQYEQARVLAAGDLHRLYETGFRAQPTRLRPLERNVPAKPVQIGEPVAFPGLLDEGKAVFQSSLRAGQISRHQGRLDKIGSVQGAGDEAACGSHRIECCAMGRDVCLVRFAHGAGVGVVVAGQQTNLLDLFFGTVGGECRALALQSLKITHHQHGPGHGAQCCESNGGSVPVT